MGSARAAFEKRFSELTASRLDNGCIERLEALVQGDDGRALLAELKADPGQVGLETLLREVDKLAAVGALALPAALLADASEKLAEAWRSRATRSYPSDLREAAAPVRLTLLAALCWMRASEITDSLVDLLIALILKVNTRADKRVERELTEDLRRVRGKEGILFRLATAAVEHPDELARTALYPVVGEKTLRELAREGKVNERARCGTCAGISSPATTCAARSRSWSTPPSPPATRTGGAPAQPAPRTQRSSARGSRT